ncbi:putative aldouronate transport system permease protein [Paenibacillus sp. UNCCL117]|uniref:carbohydrate ABC transporter permease n=1 Tax=unclassified Paenibacillus TaxID=185978 RepID=UPI00088A18BB|nr:MULTISPECIES: carbohydrate ABC transporter permease [unclassified Paenibacillus]SDC67055.1 putative aldouronate transport system permease protein [Paenibacillus sp. cl123]SFW23210.1 putative aldouronate transport system permease protein [Paenibacillus sp. UNCCL117]
MKSAGTWSDRLSDVFIYTILTAALLITLYPFLYVFNMSISDPIHVLNNTVWLFPKGFSLATYFKVFENGEIWIAYRNTLFYTVVGTLINVIMTFLAAYPLSRRTFSGRKPLMMGIVVTMFFSGGMIPSFILIQNLGIYNTVWALLLPGAVSAFNIIIARTFFQNIPESLFESAKMDGANDIGILFKIVLPLSKAILAVLTLFYAVGHWNNYFNAMLYVTDVKLQPVSLYLMKILIQNQDPTMQDMSEALDRVLFSMQLKYTMIVITTLPIVLVYPFLQKYFVQGAMIGSLKE